MGETAGDMTAAGASVPGTSASAAKAALEAAAAALFEDFHVNGHALNDFESATAARIAVAAYLDSLGERDG